MINAADLTKAHEDFFEKKKPQEQTQPEGVVTQNHSAPYPLQGSTEMYPLKGKL